MLKKSLFYCSGVLSMLFTGCSKNEAASIGIIGGADGPTAIFITSRINWWGLFGIAVIIFAIIFGAIIAIKRRK